MEPPARVPCLTHLDAAAGPDVLEDASSCAVALGLDLVLQNIMKNLSQHQRLSAAALVCMRWSSAATCVTADTGISCSVEKDASCTVSQLQPQELTLLPWMRKHGHRMPSIKLHGVEVFRNCQPFEASLPLGRLTSLELCDMGMPPDVLGCLARSMPDLRRLHLCDLYLGLDRPPGQQKCSPHVDPWPQFWLACPHLTYLHLCSCYMGAESLKGLGDLQHLHELVLISKRKDAVANLNLPLSLTALYLQSSSAFRQDICATLFVHGQRTNTAATAVSGLRSLELKYIKLHQPSILRSLTSLTALIAPHLWTEKPSDLLAVVACLHNLRYLDLSTDSVYDKDSRPNVNQNPSFGTADLKCLVAGCPDLEKLSIAVFPRPVTSDGRWSSAGPESCSLLPLQGATRLTSLTLWANKLLQDRHLEELATLTTLQSLSIQGSSDNITDMGVQELTQLTALTSLRVDARSAVKVSKEVASTTWGYMRRDVYLANPVIDRSSRSKADVQPVKSVSEQLASCCARSVVLHPLKPNDDVEQTSQEPLRDMAAAVAGGADWDAGPANGAPGIAPLEEPLLHLPSGSGGSLSPAAATVPRSGLSEQAATSDETNECAAKAMM